MPSAGKRVKRRISALISLAYLAVTRLSPLPVARGLTIAAARLAFHLVPRIKTVGRANLSLAYGDSLTPEEKERILRGAVDNMARVAAEFSHMPALARRRYEGYAVTRGEEHVDFTKGVLLIGGHLGNWEMMASVMAARGYRVAEVVRPLDDPWLDHVIDATRRGACIHTIPKDDAAREVMRLLKENWLVGILIDQSPRENAAPAAFFGQPCWATIAPALLHARAKAPIHPVSMFRQPDGCYVLEFHPALDLVRTGDLRKDLVVNTQRCQDVFEQIVRQHPEQWLWLHRRWKKHPRLEKEWQERMSPRKDAPSANQETPLG